MEGRNPNFIVLTVKHIALSFLFAFVLMFMPSGSGNMAIDFIKFYAFIGAVIMVSIITVSAAVAGLEFMENRKHLLD